MQQDWSWPQVSRAHYIIGLKFSITKKIFNVNQTTLPYIKPQLPSKLGSWRLQGLYESIFTGH